MKILKRDDVMHFDKWWEENKAVYSKAGIKKDVAATIWGAAINAVKEGLLLSTIT